MIAINWTTLEYMDEHGNVFPITNFFDEDGDECDGPENAVVCVAGSEDCWYSIDLREWRDAPSEMVQ
jgi:hypothetical protein